MEGLRQLILLLAYIDNDVSCLIVMLLCLHFLYLIYVSVDELDENWASSSSTLTGKLTSMCCLV